MKQEILDLYDNNFKKLDKTIIRRVDEIPDGANIMQAYILIKNNDKYLLEQSTERNHFKWAIPGGHVLVKETPEVALERELQEELNLRNINYQKIDMVKFPDNKFIFNIYYSEDKVNISDLKFQKEEVVKVSWLTKEEIIKLIKEEKIPKGYAFILSKYMEKSNFVKENH